MFYDLNLKMCVVSKENKRWYMVYVYSLPILLPCSALLQCSMFAPGEESTARVCSPFSAVELEKGPSVTERFHI